MRYVQISSLKKRLLEVHAQGDLQTTDNRQVTVVLY